MKKFLLFALINIASILNAMDLSCDHHEKHDRAVHRAVRLGMPIDELFALMLGNSLEHQNKFDQSLVVLLATHWSYDEIIIALQHAQYLYDSVGDRLEKISIQHAIFRYLDRALGITTEKMSNSAGEVKKRKAIAPNEDSRETKKLRLIKTPCASCGKEASATVKRQFIINGNNTTFCNACGIRYKKNGCCMKCYEVFYLYDVKDAISCEGYGCEQKIHKKCLDKSKKYSCNQCMPR